LIQPKAGVELLLRNHRHRLCAAVAGASRAQDFVSIAEYRKNTVLHRIRIVKNTYIGQFGGFSGRSLGAKRRVK
jgi:hypothetical protein